jgi:ribulose bisphosphate carboxylase small subunit
MKKSSKKVNFTKEEVDIMALAQRMNSGFIISSDKKDDFFKKVNDNRPTKEFWDECRQIRNNINQDTINEMNALMDRDDK